MQLPGRCAGGHSPERRLACEASTCKESPVFILLLAVLRQTFTRAVLCVQAQQQCPRMHLKWYEHERSSDGKNDSVCPHCDWCPGRTRRYRGSLPAPVPECGWFSPTDRNNPPQ